MRTKAPSTLRQDLPTKNLPVVIFQQKLPAISGAGNRKGEHSWCSLEEFFLPLQFQCFKCGKRSFYLKSCTRCWQAKYCDNICHKTHWPQHSLLCLDDPKRSQVLKGGHILEVNLLMMPSTCGQYPSSLEHVKCFKHGDTNHAPFVATNKFSLAHLPEALRLEQVLSYILTEAELTVRIVVNWTSLKRSDDDVFAKLRGTSRARTATGKVVPGNLRNFQKRPCPAVNCHRIHDIGHFVHDFDVKVFTNKHMIFDDEELAQTDVDFFYDSSIGSGMIKEYGLELAESGSNAERKYFTISIHDEALALRLKQCVFRRSECFGKIPHDVLRTMSAHAFVLSHPHGAPKKISVGNVVRITEENLTPESVVNASKVAELERIWFLTQRQADYVQMVNALDKLTLPVYKVWYDAATCPGSAGATVLFGARQTTGIWGPYEAQHIGYDLDAKLSYLIVPRFAT